MKNIIFDLILFLIIFPYLFLLNNQLKLHTISLYVILLSHIYIVYMRYYRKKEVKWSHCSEIIALVIGLIFNVCYSAVNFSGDARFRPRNDIKQNGDKSSTSDFNLL